MKFTCNITVNKSIEEVSQAFISIDSLKYAQKGFVDKILLSGIEHQPKATYKLIYKRFEMTETILNNSLPDSFSALYVHKHTTNTMTTNFEAIDKNTTGIKTEINYIKLNGFIINALAKLLPSMFKKQVEKWLLKFKEYVEGNH